MNPDTIARFFIIFFIFSGVLFSCHRADSSLHERALNAHSTHEKRDILNELYELTRMQKIEKGDTGSHYFNTLSVNLDATPEPELIVLGGKNQKETQLMILNQAGNKNQILLNKTIQNWYHEPQLTVLNVPGPQKMLAVRELLNHGTGIYHEVIHYIRFTENAEPAWLTLPFHAYREGWGESVSYEIKTRVKQATLNEIYVEFDYEYHLLGQEEAAAGYYIPNLVLAGGKEEVLFVFESGKWKNGFTGEENETGQLNASKVEFLMAETFDDSIFHHVFKAEIAEATAVLKGEKKAALERYLNAIP